MTQVDSVSVVSTVSYDDLWSWSLEVAETVHPVYVQRGWRWTLHDGFDNVSDRDVKEVPSVERIAAAIYGKCKRMLTDGSTEIHSGRLEVRRHEGTSEDEDDLPGFSVVLQVGEMDDERPAEHKPTVTE